MKILFCGNLKNHIQKSWQHYATLKQLGLEIQPFDFSSYQNLPRATYWLLKLSNGTYRPPAVTYFNEVLLAQCQQYQPDVLWIEKTWYLLPKTLAALRQQYPRLKLVSYQTDNPFGKRSKEFWRFFIECIPFYDLCFVMRDSDLANFQRVGARRTILSHYGFYPDLIHPRPLETIPAHLRHEVVFIGTAMDHRVQAISTLLNRQIPVHIYGNDWERQPIFRHFPTAFHPPVDDEYSLVISGSKISLGYVSSSNVDVYTERSIEIPASGGFLLGERTAKHQELYQEGVEAEFFASPDECVDKIQFYLAHEPKRAEIAKAGYERCIKSDYSINRFMREALEQIQAL